MNKLSRMFIYGLLTVSIATGGVMGLGDPPPRDPALPKMENPFVNKPRPRVDTEFRLAAAVEPAVRQEPAVSLEWAGPGTLKVKERGEYTLLVRNSSMQPLQKVVVQIRVPKDTTVLATEPASKPTDSVYIWELGTLEPMSNRPIKITMSTPSRGEMGCQAWVTFTGTAGMTVAIKEPKMAAQVIAPEKVALGDPVPVTYVVRNIGDTRIDEVNYKFAEISGPAMPVGGLDPGKEFRTVVQNRAATGGELVFGMTANGSDNTAASASTKVRVLVPRLEVKIDGPANRIVGTKGSYRMVVSNVGELPIEKVTMQCSVPDGMRLLKSEGSPNTTTGTYPRLEPGEKHVVYFETQAIVPGPYRMIATATGNRETRASSDCQTIVEGIPAMRMEVIDLSDPVEKGGETTYEIKLVNTGSKADQNLRLECELPKELQYVSSTGPTAGTVVKENLIRFEPISELSPKTEAVYRIHVKAIGNGDVRFRARLNSQYLTTPVVKEESTRIFGE